MLDIIHLGLGAIGITTIEAILAQPKHLRLVAAVDPAYAGKRLRDLAPAAPNIRIAKSLQEALTGKKAHLATVTTCSTTAALQPTAEALIDAGLHVASTCEELAYPQLRSPKIAAALDRRAKKRGVSILGTGVNPGFAMDAFALDCTAPCTRIDRIRIVRSLDAAKRRMQLQKKIGAGMTPADVRSLIRQNAIGHVGLLESVSLIAHALGWKLSDLRERFEPLIADHPLSSKFFHISPGQVCGMRMRAFGKVADKIRIELDLTMAFAADTFDEVQITGSPNLTIRTTTGFPGEASTVGLLINAARTLPTLPPGLHIMPDLLRVHSIGA